MPPVLRNDLVYRGQMEVSGAVVNGELRTDGKMYVVFVNGSIYEYMGKVGDPVVPSFSEGMMVLTGTPGLDLSGTVTEWRFPQAEQVSFTLGNVTVKREGALLKNAEVTQSQYRVRVKAGTVDVSFVGARIGTVGGKRAIIDGDSVMMIETAGGCGCKK